MVLIGCTLWESAPISIGYQYPKMTQISKNGYTRSVLCKNGYALNSSAKRTPRPTRLVADPSYRFLRENDPDIPVNGYCTWLSLISVFFFFFLSLNQFCLFFARCFTAAAAAAAADLLHFRSLPRLFSPSTGISLNQPLCAPAGCHVVD